MPPVKLAARWVRVKKTARGITREWLTTTIGSLDWSITRGSLYWFVVAMRAGETSPERFAVLLTAPTTATFRDVEIAARVESMLRGLGWR